jgi:glycosyltransferase involved in cell wall biosynthesis
VSKTNILFISLDGLTDPLGQAQILPYLEGLSSLGYQIHILSAEKQQPYELNEEAIRTRCVKAGIEWHHVSYIYSPPMIGPLMTYFKLSRKSRLLLKTRPFDVIHARSYLPAMIGLSLKARFKTKLLFDMRGLWADEKIDGNIWRLSNPVHFFLFKFLKYKERILLNRADAIVSLTEKAVDFLKSRFQGSSVPPQISVIPCCTDLSLFDYNRFPETMRMAVRRELKIRPEDFVLCYSGSLSTWYLPAEMMQVYKRLLLVKPDAHFLILTKEAEKPILELAEQLDIPLNRIIIRNVNRPDVPLLLSVSDLGICFIKPAFSKMASSPVKLGEMLGTGLAVICNHGIGDTDNQITLTDAGVICKGYSNEHYDQAIQKAITLMLTKNKDHFRQCAKVLFDLQMGIGKYDSLYRNLTARPNDDTAHSSKLS